MSRSVIFFALLGLLAVSLVSGHGHERRQCYTGLAVYSEDKSKVYASYNISRMVCPRDQQCGMFSWFQYNEEANGTIYLETGFCSPSSPNCSVLPQYTQGVTPMNCTSSLCATDLCNKFGGLVCATGNVAYDLSKTIIGDNRGNYSVCQPNQRCGMLRFESTFPASNNTTAYVETGFCIDSKNVSCEILKNYPEAGMVNYTSCIAESCNETGCTDFTIEIQPNRPFRCDQGTLIFSADKTSIYDVQNFSTAPCKNKSDVCAMFRFYNTDKQNQTGYVETGACAPLYELQYFNCEAVRQDNRTNIVTNCTTELCSGDFCAPFTPFQNQENCPPRPDDGDIQVLPSCTAKEALNSVFECLGTYAGNIPYADEQVCKSDVDQMIACIASVATDCLAVHDGCHYTLNEIPNIEDIFEIITNLTSQIDSVAKLQQIIGMLTNNTVNLNELDLLCVTNSTTIAPTIEQLRNTILNFPIGLGMPICSDNNILDDLIRWALENAVEIASAKQHSDVCKAFDKLKLRMVDAVVRRCWNLDYVQDYLVRILPPYYAKVIQLGINIAKNFLSQLEIPNCSAFPFPAHVICYEGSVSYSLENRNAVYTQDDSARVCEFGSICQKTSWVNTNPRGEKAFVEHGQCYNPMNGSYICNNLTIFDQVSAVENCSTETCSTLRCNKFSKDMCRDVAADDVAILPRCSLSETLEGAFRCANNFLGGFPYEDDATCRANIAGTINCVINGMRVCLSGDCFTILDPFVPKSIYRDVLRAILEYQVNGTDIFRVLFQDQAEMVYGAMCRNPEAGQSIRDMIQSIVNSTQGLDMVVPQNVCTGNILEDLIRWGSEAVEGFVTATTHQQVCSTFKILTSRLVEAWNTRCDLNELLKLFGPALPQYFRNSIEVGVNVVIKFLEEVEIGNCDGNLTIPMFNCSQFYYDYSTCGMRRAWLCDYVNWKIDFLTNWLRQFQDYVMRNGILDAAPAIACIPMRREGLCTDDSDAMCMTSQQGCQFCFCKSHSYRNPSSAMEVYRRDYSTWRLVYGRYKRVFDQVLGPDSCMIMG